MNTNDLTPDDWTLEGRKNFVEEHRDRIVLIIEHAAETLLDDETVSTVYGSMDKVPDEVINRFLVPELDSSKLPCTDISVFSELHFWTKHKTRGRKGAARQSGSSFPDVDGVEGASDLVLDPMEKVATTLKRLNSKVDADLVGFWLEANKKFKEYIGDQFEGSAEDTCRNTSPPQRSRYKADACFRFNYLHLKLGNIPDVRDRTARRDYESKYFQKGNNSPQYVYRGTEPESHQTKQEIRTFIMRLIEQLSSMNEDLDNLERILLKPALKKALLDLYEFDDSMTAKGRQLLSTLENNKAVV
ncbi:hypothetical protein [Bacterioplanoides pacificum]|uniref:Uncharacterized protein n=1 Tax=Bacterioplanoides pacificum TaxID=1171596 RepID=A0ABV7VNE2_9GAMM